MCMRGRSHPRKHSPLLPSLSQIMFPSFLRTAKAEILKPAHWHFTVYASWDSGDPIYDTPTANVEFRGVFESLLAAGGLPKESVALKMIAPREFPFASGAPSQVVSMALNTAVVDGAEYLYQVNDDTHMDSKGWAPMLVAKLRENAYMPNLGVTGPMDTNNHKIFTHVFVHRTHFEIFGYLFPPAFKNWWSDDWISGVYGSSNTILHAHAQVTHEVDAQKSEPRSMRYHVDRADSTKLAMELQKGGQVIKQWLHSRGIDAPLHITCSYTTPGATLPE